MSASHICLDCGAVGHAGGYHDHGDGNAGDNCSIAEVLRIAREAGAAEDARDELAEALGRALFLINHYEDEVTTPEAINAEIEALAEVLNRHV